MSNVLKAKEYPAEIRRVKKLIEAADSKYLKRDLEKYLKRLKREYVEYLRWIKVC